MSTFSAVSRQNPSGTELTNTRHKIFVEEYCTGGSTGKAFNAFRAAEHAGYANPGATGGQLLKRADVKAAIAARLDELSMTSEEIVKRLTDIARNEVGEIYEVNDLGQIRLNPAQLRAAQRHMKSYKIDSNGNQVIEFHDSHAALRDLAKARGIFKEGREISGPGGGPIGVVNLNLNFVKGAK
jgi:phage terminase small subunit